MNHQSYSDRLLKFSTHLEELIARVSGRVTETLTPELADEIAATAGEVMVELADHRGDELTRDVIEDARRLRAVVRSIRPEAGRVTEAGRALVYDLELVIREDRRAA